MSLLNGTELCIRPISVAAADLVFVRHILEAYEGLGLVVGNRGGNVLLVSTNDMAHELELFIGEMMREVELSTEWTAQHQEVMDAIQ
ncbi:MAG TPA: DUF4911 domain-containing protein [Polyangiaceae bacterium]|nr:DUF4911 domain-containing protein [Polyangiaceae bacterium]